MEQLNKQRRDKLIYELWEEKKNEWTMQDLADIFNIHLKSIYRIIKGLSNPKDKGQVNRQVGIK